MQMDCLLMEGAVLLPNQDTLLTQRIEEMRRKKRDSLHSIFKDFKRSIWNAGVLHLLPLVVGHDAPRGGGGRREQSQVNQWISNLGKVFQAANHGPSHSGRELTSVFGQTETDWSHASLS